MSQATNFSVPTVGPLSPTAMAQRIDDNFKAALTGHSGSSRPAYLTQPGVWVSTATAGKLKWMAFDGTDDRVFMVLDLATGAVTHGDGVNDDLFSNDAVWQALATELGLRGTHQTFFDPSSLSADRTIRLPDADGALGAWEVIDIATVTGITSYVKTGLDAFRELHLSFDVNPDAVASNFTVQVSPDNGVSWFVSGNQYYTQYVGGNGGSAVAAGQTFSGFPTSFGNNVIVGTNGGHQVDLTLYSFNKARFLRALGAMAYQLSATGVISVLSFAGGVSATAPRNAIRLTSGNAFSGRIILEGIRG